MKNRIAIFYSHLTVFITLKTICTNKTTLISTSAGSFTNEGKQFLQGFAIPEESDWVG